MKIDKNYKSMMMSFPGCNDIQSTTTWSDYVIASSSVPTSRNVSNTLLCDGSWTIILRRVDGSVDFMRGWDEYVDGFGDMDTNFWIGLETIHLLTASGNSHLKVYMESFSDGR